MLNIIFVKKITKIIVFLVFYKKCYIYAIHDNFVNVFTNVKLKKNCVYEI